MANDISQWITNARKSGKTDKQIREELLDSGWLPSQVDSALDGSDDIKKEISRGMSSSPTNRKAYITVGVVLLVVALAVGLYFINDAYDLLNTNGSTGNTNTPLSTSGSFPTVSAQLAAQSQLKQFENYDAVADFVSTNATADSYGYYGRALTDELIVEDMAPTVTSDVNLGTTFGLGTADLEAAAPSQAVDYSDTNIQVAGVDEADIVKTDGEYIYAISGDSLYITDARPAAEMSIVSTIVFDNAPQQMYVHGDILIVHGADWNIEERPIFDSIRSSSYTYVKIFDISDRSNPEQLRHLDFEGSHVQSRMIDDYLYFVTSQPTYTIYENNPVPMLLEDDAVVPLGSDLFQPDVYYVDLPYYAQNYTTISAIDVTDADSEIASDMFLLSGTENMYVSLDNMYIAYTKYISEIQLTVDIISDLMTPRLSDTDQQRISDIQSAANHVLSQEEKTSKIMAIIQRYIQSLDEEAQDTLAEEIETAVTQAYEDISKELEKTVIHRISLDGSDIQYAATGEVTGHVLNQFSMDEHEGYFRIATTRNRTWSSFGEGSIDSYNNLYVLNQDLETVGSVENLAEGERIYSVRFMQGRAYLVTFRQVDPLFVIDVSDPRNPTVLGELKVPGFSSYLHPYNENLLIGFGKQADENGSVQGLKLSLFDVSDVSNLREVDTYEMGDRGSDSIALNDHKAFLFDQGKNLLVIPVSLRDGDATFGNYQTHGAMVFAVTLEGFDFRERIDHSDGSADDNEIQYFYSYQYYDTMVKRSLYIEDTLYTVSNKYLKAHQLSDLSETRSLQLSTSTDGDFRVIQ